MRFDKSDFREGYLMTITTMSETENIYEGIIKEVDNYSVVINYTKLNGEDIVDYTTILFKDIKDISYLQNLPNL